MKVPSRMVVMENLPPQKPNGSQVETVDVRYIGNSSDYFRTAHVPEIADADYRRLRFHYSAQEGNQSREVRGRVGGCAGTNYRTAEDFICRSGEKAWRLNQPVC
jgi:hypothetical protein